MTHELTWLDTDFPYLKLADPLKQSLWVRRKKNGCKKARFVFSVPQSVRSTLITKKLLCIELELVDIILSPIHTF